MQYKFSTIWQTEVQDILTSFKNNTNLPFKIMNFKGARLSGKTKAGIGIACLAVTQAKVKLYGFRYFTSDLEPRLIEDFLIVLNQIGISYHYYATRKKIVFSNGSEFDFWGLKKRSSDEVNLKGLPECGNYDYVIIFKDEITEYDSAANEAVNEAVRGMREGRLLELRTWNANMPEHFANKHLLKYLPEDIKLMKSVGFTKRVCYTKENDCNEFFSQNNVLTNPFVGPEELRNLVSQRERDPLRAHTMLFGLDGITDKQTYPNWSFNTMTYSEIYNIIHKEITKDKSMYKINFGWDYGLNDKTCFVLALVHKHMGVYVLGSWSYSRKNDGIIDEEHLASKAAKKVEEILQMYNIDDKDFMYDCDNLTIVEWMQKKLKHKIVNLRPAKKWKVNERIVVMRMIMDKKKLSFVYGTVYDEYQDSLKSEFRMSQLEYDKDNVLKRTHGENDLLNALEYAIFYSGTHYYDYLLKKGAEKYDW